jgi:acyl-CoA synthetase (AMP-forming)/AMP-acid ligase II
VTGRAEPAGADDPHPLNFVACGQPLPGHEIRVVDALGHELGERREGRLEFKGPSATAGYFRNPAKTALLIHEEWHDAGDLAYIAEGEIYLTGRIKDVIIRGGRHIYPFEIEEAVGALPGVRKGCVAVFGSPDPVLATERLVVLAEQPLRDRHDAQRRGVLAIGLERPLRQFERALVLAGGDGGGGCQRIVEVAMRVERQSASARSVCSTACSPSLLKACIVPFSSQANALLGLAARARS